MHFSPIVLRTCVEAHFVNLADAHGRRQLAFEADDAKGHSPNPIAQPRARPATSLNAEKPGCLLAFTGRAHAGKSSRAGGMRVASLELPKQSRI